MQRKKVCEKEKKTEYTFESFLAAVFSLDCADAPNKLIAPPNPLDTGTVLAASPSLRMRIMCWMRLWVELVLWWDLETQMYYSVQRSCYTRGSHAWQEGRCEKALVISEQKPLATTFPWRGSWQTRATESGHCGLIAITAYVIYIMSVTMWLYRRV